MGNFDVDAMFSFGTPRPKSLMPKKHKGKPVGRKFEKLKTRVTPSVTDRRGYRIRWVYTTTRNTEGFFVACREVYSPKHGLGFRDEYRARKTRWRVKEWCLDQYNKSKYRTGPKYRLPSEIKATRKAWKAANPVQPDPVVIRG